MATASDLIDDTRRRLADYDDEAFSDSEIRDWLNEGMEIFCAGTGCFSRTAETYATGSVDYDDLTRPVDVFAVSYGGEPLFWAPQYEVDSWPISGQEPTGWSQWDQTIYFDGTPDGSTLTKIYYFSIPDEMTSNTDTFGLSDQYRAAVIAYAEYRARAKDREGPQADRAYIEFDNIKKSTAAIYYARHYNAGKIGG